MITFDKITPDMEDLIDIVALITKYETRPTKSGKDYLDLELTTKEGVMLAKKWTILPEDKEKIKNGTVIKAKAKVNVYQGNMSLIIDSMQPIAIDASEFKLTAMEKVNDITEEFKSYLNSISNKKLKVVLDDLMTKSGEKFYIHPAAKANHHNEEHGLLYHTTRMLRAADALCSCYNKEKEVVNRDLVLTGIVFHDIAKLDELEQAPTGAGEYTKMSLLGHIAMGAMKIESYHLNGMLDDETALQLEHIVLSHHGKLEYGSPVVPCTPEAVLVSMIDNLDAKLYTVQTEELRLHAGEMAKNSIPSLDGARIYKPLPIE